jgi:NAD+ diphosphatase
MVGNVARACRTLPDLAFAAPVLDRGREHRKDPDWLPGRLADPATAVLDLFGDRALVTADGTSVLTRPPEPADRTREAAYLGEAAGTAYVAVLRFESDLDDLTPRSDGARARSLRSAGGGLEPLAAAVFVTAVGLFNWHRTHRFCPRCGGPTGLAMSGWIRVCPADGSEHYPRTDPAVIMAVTDPSDRLLLARAPGFTAEGMSVLAGFVEPGETLEGAVAREVAEEVGLDIIDVVFAGDQPWPFPSSLMIGFRARSATTELRLQEDEIAAARWFTRDELAAEVAAERVHLPSRVSISRRLIEDWYGSPIEARERLLRRERG